MKKRIAIAVQISARPIINAIGNQRISSEVPRDADFKSLMPCVSGIMSAAFCSVAGIISYGSVTPEKMSMGKYSTLARTLAILMFGATPPTKRHCTALG